MTVQLKDDGVIALVGDCPSGEAEVLLQHLVRAPDAVIDWRGCQSAHTAVIQVLLVARRVVKGPPAGAFLADVVAPRLKQR